MEFPGLDIFSELFFFLFMVVANENSSLATLAHVTPLYNLNLLSLIEMLF
jgi:hypothetical protein